LAEHQAYSTIKYTDNGSKVVYTCICGAEDTPDDELWGQSWLINHQTQEIVKAL